MIDKHVFADVLIEGLDDWVPIDQLIWAAQEKASDHPWKDYFAELLHFLLESGLIQIGELAEEGFSPWIGEASHVVRFRCVCELPDAGRFEVQRNIKGESVTIRGAMINGVPRIGTAFIPSKFHGKR